MTRWQMARRQMMRRQRRGPIVAMALASVLVLAPTACGRESSGGSSAPSTEATPGTTVAQPDDQARAAFCAAMSDAGPAMVALGLAKAFSGLSTTSPSTTPVTVGTGAGQDVLVLMASPSLQRVFAAAAAATTGPPSATFADVAATLAQGVDRLRRAGLSDSDIDALVPMDLSAGQLPATLDRTALEGAARGFAAELDQAFAQLETAEVGAAFETLLAGCDLSGGVTTGVAICQTLSEDLVTAVLGAVPVIDGPIPGFAGGTSCRWEAADGGEIAVTVAGSSYYDQVVSAYTGVTTTTVTGLGDQAFVADGFNDAAGGGTSGRSLFVRTGDRTVVVALNLTDQQPTDQQLTELADAVIASLR